MKNILQTIFVLFILTNCSDKPKDIGTISKDVSSYSLDTLHIFYKNDSINVSGGIHPKDPYPDTAIFFLSTTDLFTFEKDKRVINLYYDKALKILAARYELDKVDKSEHYKRFDRKGVLRMEFSKRTIKTLAQI